MKKSYWASAPTRPARRSAGAAREGKEGDLPGPDTTRRHATFNTPIPRLGTANLLASPAFHRPLWGPKSTPGRPKIDSQRLKNGARIVQKRLGAPKNVPRAAQEPRKTYQECPKSVQEAPKRCPRDPKRRRRGAKEDPGGAKRVPKQSPKGPKSIQNQGKIPYRMHRVSNSVFEANLCIFSLELLSLE